MSKQLFTDFENGKFTALGRDIDVSNLPWNVHKDFEGVLLKWRASQLVRMSFAQVDSA